MAVGSWDTAAPYIVATGQEVMPMGGFSGTVPEPTVARVQDLVRTGQLRFFLVDSVGGVAGFGLAGREGAAATIDAWVQSACSAVPATDYQATAGTPGSGLGGPGGAGGFGATAGTLYECQRTA
jgi:4-amino-4-deoxy-L-arabinose transferase-like glycosyltransferase